MFDESLNFRKIPPVITPNKAPEINGKPVELRPRAPDTLEPRALRRRTWNREEVREEEDVRGGKRIMGVGVTSPPLPLRVRKLNCPMRDDSVAMLGMGPGHRGWPPYSYNECL